MQVCFLKSIEIWFESLLMLIYCCRDSLATEKSCLLCPFKVWREPADEEHSGGAALHSDRQSQAKGKSQKGVWINCLRDLRSDWRRNVTTHLQFGGRRLKKAKQNKTTATTASITSQINLALLYPRSLPLETSIFRVYVLVWICAKVSQMMQRTRMWRGGLFCASTPSTSVIF